MFINPTAIPQKRQRNTPQTVARYLGQANPFPKGISPPSNEAAEHAKLERTQTERNIR